jgi:ubiquinone biosynthesis monooxygenase Coq6
MSEEEFTDNLNNAFWKVYPKHELVKCGMKAFQTFLESLQLKNDSLRQLPPSIDSIVNKSRAVFPLGFGHAVHYVQPGVVLVG